MVYAGSLRLGPNYIYRTKLFNAGIGSNQNWWASQFQIIINTNPPSEKHSAPLQRLVNDVNFSLKEATCLNFNCFDQGLSRIYTYIYIYTYPVYIDAHRKASLQPSDATLTSNSPPTSLPDHFPFLIISGTSVRREPIWAPSRFRLLFLPMSCLQCSYIHCYAKARPHRPL